MQIKIMNTCPCVNWIAWYKDWCSGELGTPFSPTVLEGWPTIYKDFGTRPPSWICVYNIFYIIYKMFIYSDIEIHKNVNAYFTVPA